MNTINPREWFQARLKWAVMEEGRGLTLWPEAEHIFLSENPDAAFQEALRIGYAEECSLIPNQGDGLPVVDFRFAEDSWRDRRPKLAAWHARLAERPSMRATKPEDVY